MKRICWTVLGIIFLLPVSYASDALPSNQLANILGWQKSDAVGNVCGGFYKELPITMPANAEKNETVLNHADHAVLRKDKPSELIGNIKVTQAGRQLQGDKATLQTDKKTNKLRQITMTGNVRMREPGMLVAADKATLNVKHNTAQMQDAHYRYQITPQNRVPVYDDQHNLKSMQIEGINYRGQADKVHQIKPKHINLYDSSFTSCNPYSDAWRIKASKIRLNQETGVGTSYNTFLLLHGIPVLYTPYFQFPIDNRRKSGFLAPIMQQSSISGFTFGAPFYWNMAPNYDMTITPNYISKRGYKFDDLFRYLDNVGSGQLYYSILPNDKLFEEYRNEHAGQTSSNPQTQNQLDALRKSSLTRTQFGWVDSSQFSKYLTSMVDIDYVSDDYYLQDFGDSPLAPPNSFSDIVPTTQLTQTASMTYARQHWSVDAQLENFQTLHPLTLGPPPTDQYSRLPDIDVNGVYPNFLPHFNFNMHGEFSRFTHPLLENNFKTNLTVTGNRYIADPTLGWYGGKAWGYINPKVSFNETYYELTGPVINPTTPSLSQKPFMQRAVPTYDLDMGMYFDRSTHFGHTNYTQTLEPRLFYLYVPFVKQDNLPNFDSGISPALTYDQLFNTNRFEGYDRIGDADHLTAGVTSRFIQNATGNDVLDMSLGQILYFAKRRVTLPGMPNYNNVSEVSPLVGQLSWQVNNHWNLTSNAAYDTIHNWLQSANMALSYSADQKHFVTSGVTYLKGGSDPTVNNPADNLRTGNLGFTWPISTHWQSIAGINYDFTNGYPQTYLYGVEYDSCCWSIRAINSQRFIGFQTNSTRLKYDKQYFIQFVLKGLTSGGNNSPNALLQYTLPGYNDTYGANPLFANP